MQEGQTDHARRLQPEPSVASVRGPRSHAERKTEDAIGGDDDVPEIAHGHPLPTSRFPPVPLVRPLETFGATFAVEVSSHLCLGPDTVLRAAIGKSLQTLLRDGGLLQPLKQLRYALRGEHKLTPTTRKTVLRAFGPMATSLTSVLDGAPAPEELQSMSDWQCVASSWGVLSEDNLLDVIVACFVKLDELGEAATALKAAGRIQEAEAMVATRFDQTLPAWQQVCPELSLEGCLRIETSLMVLAEAETLGAPGKARPTGRDSVVESFLDPKAKPLGHWLREVLSVTKCSDLRDLSDLLERKQVRHQRTRPISHDTLKAWSATKPGMVMSLEGCQSLLMLVANKQSKDRLLSRYALARFLAFMCDFLRASVHAESPNWKEAQRMLLTRYLQLVEARDGWLSEQIASAESNSQHPLNAVNS